MTATYVAWNGKPYPSPPPEGWYEASDGRWWAPGTGPNPPGISQQQPSLTGQKQAALASRPAAATDAANGQPPKVVDTSMANGSATRSDDPAADNTLSRSTAGTAVDATDDATDETVELKVEDGLGSPPATAATDPLTEQRTIARQRQTETPRSNRAGRGRSPSRTATSTTGRRHSAQQSRQQQRRSVRDGVLILIIAVALLAALGLAVLALTGNGGSDDIATTASVEPDSPSTTEAPTATTTIEAPSTAAAPTEAPATTTTTAAAQTTTTPTQAEQVTKFRANLEANDLSTDSLTDGDIVDFGQSFCLFAIVSGDGDEFAVYRQRAIEESSTDLTPAELAIAIDEAVSVFCPQHATRLGIL